MAERDRQREDESEAAHCQIRLSDVEGLLTIQVQQRGVRPRSPVAFIPLPALAARKSGRGPSCGSITAMRRKFR